MHDRMPDSDLRPRHSTTSPTPMRSSFDVDDDGDTLDALVADALGPAHRRDARHTALAAMPSSLCQPVGGVAWPVRPAARRSVGALARSMDQALRAREPIFLGTMLSAALALVMFAAAVLWRLAPPRVVHVDDEAADRDRDREPPGVDVDVISSATRR